MVVFSSNQVLEVSGTLHSGDLLRAIAFALDLDDFKGLSNEGRGWLAYQITEDGRYCLGRVYNDSGKEGWTMLLNAYSLEDVEEVITKFLENQEVKRGKLDGLYVKGFRMKAIPESTAKEFNGIKNPFWGLVEFSPFVAYFSK